jgi:tRNA (guanine-N7-)-methyltransferase
MPRTKQIKYNLFKDDSNCIGFSYFDNPIIVIDKIKEWNKPFNKVFVELCAGYGEYTIDFAINNPDTLCIAIDIKEDRLMSCNNIAKSLGLTNVRCIRTEISYIDKILMDSIDTMYIVHPDPQVIYIKKRLNQPKYIEQYLKCLKKDGVLRLITDNINFFKEFKINIMNQTNIIPLINTINAEQDLINIIKTRYNQKFINNENQTKVLEIKKITHNQ